MSTLQITLPNPYHDDVGGVPVRVDVRDVSLDFVTSVFVPFGQSRDVPVSPGTYVVEAELPSGKSLRRVVSVEENQAGDAQMDTSGLSPHEFHAWAYLNKSATQFPTRSLRQPTYESAWVRLWRKPDGEQWRTVDGELEDGSSWDDDGVNYRLRAFGGTQMLQVGGPDIPWKFVALPGAQDLRILIRPADGPEDRVHPLDIVVATHNTDAEAILSMLTNGAIDQAEALGNAGVAEQMLYSKMSDPTAAAIGGYFLLKTGDLGRLHDWSENLANWIDWMADGPVIRAWHLLKAVRYEGLDADAARLKARGFLLEAVERGIPIYTEGLRLLRDGINILGRDPDDNEARDAKAVVSGYTQSCDWAAPLTTFLGARPDEPSPQPRTGKPESLDNLLFLYNVDTEELVRQGLVNVGSTLTLNRFDDSPVQVMVEADGELNLDGKRFKRLQDVAESVGMPHTSQYEWRPEDSGEPMYEEIQDLRHGRFKTYQK